MSRSRHQTPEQRACRPHAWKKPRPTTTQGIASKTCGSCGLTRYEAT